MFGIGMIVLVGGTEIVVACALLWAALKLRGWARIQEKESARIQREWLAVADNYEELTDKYEELAKHAEELAKGATELEERERNRVMAKGYAEIYGGSKPDPDKVN